MTLQTQIKPLVMGALMGLMMLAMLHMVLTSDSALGGMALFAFIGIHIAIVLGVAVLGWWATRFSPTLAAKITSLHKPSVSHIATMLFAALVTAALIHLMLHGGI